MSAKAKPNVVIWTNKGCGACVRAKQLFENKQVEVTERRLKNSPSIQRAFSMASRGAKTVPQILIDGTLVGGFDHLLILEKSGELDVMLGLSDSLPERSAWQRFRAWAGLGQHPKQVLKDFETFTLLMDPSINVLGGPLQTCSNEPLTGWYRDGCCNTDSNDRGSHTVCCVLNENFLQFAKGQGNDLITPVPEFNFPGLKPGDSWCVCARTWLDAVNAGQACPLDLEATHEHALKIIPLGVLETHAV